jgi:hypothetical protein
MSDKTPSEHNESALTLKEATLNLDQRVGNGDYPTRVLNFIVLNTVLIFSLERRAPAKQLKSLTRPERSEPPTPSNPGLDVWPALWSGRSPAGG